MMVGVDLMAENFMVGWRAVNAADGRRIDVFVYLFMYFYQ
jgi:hypothetical protein